jgi:hypothetical protein
VLHCITDDPRVDRQIESRGRYLGELVATLRADLTPIVRSLAGADEDRLGHEVLAAAAACGHGPARALLEDPRVDESLRGHVAMWLVDWGVLKPVALSPPIRARVMAQMLDLSDSAAVASGLQPRQRPDLAAMSVDDLLEFARSARVAQLDDVHAELVQRTSPADRERLWSCLRDDPVHGRVRTAARALGAMDDDRVLALCEQLFAREDVLDDPARTLAGLDRMRRAALAGYVRQLPGPRQLDLARRWHPRGGYFATVAGTAFADHATRDDRTYLERHVAADVVTGSGWNIISELDALARLADPRSAPLLAEVAEQVAYSHARRRAVHALAMIASETGARMAALREALWDSEDEAAADACAFVPELDEQARGRVAELARGAVFDDELRRRARRRLRRGGGPTAAG